MIGGFVTERFRAIRRTDLQELASVQEYRAEAIWQSEVEEVACYTCMRLPKPATCSVCS